MSRIRVFTAEFQQERRAVVKGFTEKTACVTWAKERIVDESIGAISLWQLETDQPAKEALAIAAEGKSWFTLRSCFAVITRAGTRVMR
jgi:hypothetical protein